MCTCNASPCTTIYHYLIRVPDSERLEGTCGDNLLQHICSKQSEQVVLRWVLNTFKKNDSKVSGQPFPMLAHHLQLEIFFLCLNRILHFSICATASCPLTGYH